MIIYPSPTRHTGGSGQVPDDMAKYTAPPKDTTDGSSGGWVVITYIQSTIYNIEFNAVDSVVILPLQGFTIHSFVTPQPM